MTIPAVLVIVAAVMAWQWRDHGSPSSEWPIGSPKDRLVSFSLDRRPVPGWKITAGDIGLPPGADFGELFATSGVNAYFITTQCNDPCVDPDGWLYGLNTQSGSKLFPPVKLAGFYDGLSGGSHGTFADCYNNGPGIALCVSDKYDSAKHGGDDSAPRQVWVVDLNSGSLSFTGKSDLRLRGETTPRGQQRLQTVGNFRGESRVVAVEDGKGVFGIGLHAELTWFVPGSGNLIDHNFFKNSQTAPVTIAVQSPISPAKTARILSVLDGKDLTPTAPSGITLDAAVSYPGGFAYQYSNDNKSDDAGIMFYDEAGTLVARDQHGRAYLMENSQMPIVSEQSRWSAYSATGKHLIDMPARGATASFQVIGTKLYIDHAATAGSDDNDGSLGASVPWQQWDLLTGHQGATCTMSLDTHFVTSDGNIIVTTGDNTPESAVDPTTCRTIWSPPAHSEIHQVGTGLIQINWDDASIVSLRAPA